MNPEGLTMRPFGISLLSLTLTLMLASAADSYKPTSSGTLSPRIKGLMRLALSTPWPGKQLTEVPEGGITGHEVIASPDGKVAYVPIYGNSGRRKKGHRWNRNIVVIDILPAK